MKRFAVFAGEEYYPAGGCNDLRGCFETFAGAMEVVRDAECDWWNVLDLLTGEIVTDSSREGPQKPIWLYGEIVGWHP